MGQGGRGDFSARRYRFSQNLMDLDGDASTSGGDGYIVHYVSKLDTLAGIAIKYGVEVADVKRLNGLSTDLQMFARKSLRIPSSAKHPPSEQLASHSNASSDQPRLGRHSFCDIILPNKSEEPTKVSSAMNLMRGYYGLSASKLEGEGTEMDVYRADNGYQSEDEPFTPRDQVSNRPGAHHAPTDSATEPKLASFNSMVSMARNFVAHEVEKARERVAVRRRPKGEALAAEDHSAKQQLLGDRTNYAVRSSVPRPKASRLGVEVELDCPAVRAVFNSGGRHSTSEAGNGSKGFRSGKVVEELIFKLKKSPSAPDFQDDKPPPFSMLRNGSKGDLAGWSQAQNQSSVTIPLLDSFTRRSKAALD